MKLSFLFNEKDLGVGTIDGRDISGDGLALGSQGATLAIDDGAKGDRTAL